ncbi:hypothetical protein [Methylocystis sp.]
MNGKAMVVGDQAIVTSDQAGQLARNGAAEIVEHGKIADAEAAE